MGINYRLLTPLALLFATPLAAQASQRDLSPYLMADRAAEIALARTAAPRSISDSATILVMTRQGLVEAVHGSNGFDCLVLRSFSAAVTDPNFWDPRIRAPHCLNAPAVRTILPEMKQRVEWVLAGVGAADIGTRTSQAYASHQLPAPAPGAMAYMLSPRQHLAPENPHWVPHLMFYLDPSMPAATFGAGGMDAPMIDATADEPHPPVVVVLVPVRRWSDGSSAMMAKGQ